MKKKTNSAGKNDASHPKTRKYTRWRKARAYTWKWNQCCKLQTEPTWQPVSNSNTSIEFPPVPTTNKLEPPRYSGCCLGVLPAPCGPQGSRKHKKRGTRLLAVCLGCCQSDESRTRSEKKTNKKKNTTRSINDRRHVFPADCLTKRCSTAVAAMIPTFLIIAGVISPWRVYVQVANATYSTTSTYVYTTHSSYQDVRETWKCKDVKPKSFLLKIMISKGRSQRGLFFRFISVFSRKFGIFLVFFL